MIDFKRNQFYSHYKGVFYKYIPFTGKDRRCSGIWLLSEEGDGSKILFEFNADIYRIDQCFDLYFKAMQERNSKKNNLEVLIGEYDRS